MILEPKDPNELIIITYEFCDDLYPGDTIVSIPAVMVETYSGEDLASASVLTGIAVINTPTSVQQPMSGGVDGVTYKIKVLVQTKIGELLTGTAIIPVSTQ